MSGRTRPIKRRHRSEQHSILEDHYRVDLLNNVVLPGVHRYDDDFNRDCHDFFNLIVLIPIVVLNGLCWDWDKLYGIVASAFSTKLSKEFTSLSDAWVGDWFQAFWNLTMAYFAIDLIWVASIPGCVKSPGTIIKHHIATLLYIVVPHFQPSYQWCMGACMCVEINTWFLIARRIFNKQGFPPWIIKLPFLFSVRVKLISILFYGSWVAIRCIFYPLLLVYFHQQYVEIRKKSGSVWNVMAFVIPLHFVFCALNYKWSYDLLMSKIRYWRSLRTGRRTKDNDYGGSSKGL